ncbi:hypothetical protein P153DRAFT_395600 [Dothidotthia symphoricarpi CBS 119687]|uniref:Heterokaryon incompatibility domain-containing protein n=1 Tax=Dothidotthia symphoricarpi CBS 119687 TaxID=1392245 RepID=A0A6A6AJD0_9PLEO|nr:uncharacterized protein P153DRAFT_395600 [Dothidotthia symphoricarpi CBS 119687]KAF2131218.1 hypothetical protein P153DRAFT_395600 [Dothidotthia symphoricarpi CBS 119687]
MEPSIYTPLPPGQHIRLATILRGRWSDPLNIKLTPTKLNVATFFALSYCWGTTLNPTTITINGQSHNVTQNLTTALRRVRRSDMDVVGWIDAICIDQTCIPERNAQVSLMRQIYQRAASVVIYIGEETEDTTVAIKVIMILHEIIGLKQKTAKDRLLRQTGLSSMPTFASRMPTTWDEMCLETLIRSLPVGDSPDWLAFGSFYNRPWFGRIWVLQEMVAAQDEPVVVCGERVFPWSTIGAVAHYYQYEAGLVGRVVRNEEEIDLSYCALRMYLSRIDYHQNQKSSLLGLLKATESFSATDPRDKVFALLGLVGDSNGKSSFYADYAKDVVEVYRNVTRHILYNDSSLDILSCVGEISKQDPKYKNLPSWAPDWSQEVFSTRLVKELGNMSKVARLHYSVSGVSTVKLLPHSDRNVIGILGSYVDEIIAIADRFPIWDDVSEEHPAHTSFRQPTDQWDNLAYKLDPYPGGGRTLDAFWRTLVANVDRHGMPVRDDVFYDFANFCYDLPGSPTRIDQVLKSYFDRALIGANSIEALPGDKVAFIYLLRRASFGRRFFTTKKGYMGIGPADGRVGDKVYIFSGGKVPFILRKHTGCEKSTNDGLAGGKVTQNDTGDVEGECGNLEQEFMSFVGEAYVHGIMKGESIEKIGGKHEWQNVFLRYINVLEMLCHYMSSIKSHFIQ